MTFDDRDIKIFSKNNKDDDTQALLRLAEEMASQRANGNVRKATELGEKIADFIFNIDSIDDESVRQLVNSSLVDEKVNYQIRMLLTFTSESTLHRSLNVASLSTIAVNSMYDRLMTLDPDFYEDTTDAFTFYYVALRKANGVTKSIGKTFAMLCGDGNNEDYIRIGSGLYLLLGEEVCETIESFNFITD